MEKLICLLAELDDNMDTTVTQLWERDLKVRICWAVRGENGLHSRCTTLWNSFNLVSFVCCIPECLRDGLFFFVLFFSKNRTGLHSADHHHPSPVISPLSSIEISLLLTLTAFSLYLSLSQTHRHTHTHTHTHTPITTCNIYTVDQLELKSLHSPFTPDSVCMHAYTHTHWDLWDVHRNKSPAASGKWRYNHSWLPCTSSGAT